MKILLLLTVAIIKANKMQTFNHTPFFILSEADRKSTLESLIFTAEEPVSSKQILNMLVDVEISIADKTISQDSSENENNTEIEVQNTGSATTEYFDKLIEEINKDYALSARPFRILLIAGGWQFGILPEYGMLIHKHFKTKIKKKFSQAALETLAIIAYKQPVSKPEIEQIRGVNSNEMVNSLIEKNLVKIAGRSETLGKPLIYATTQEFLRTFGINSLEDLPKLKEMEELSPNKPESNESENDVILNITENLEELSIKESEEVIENDDLNNIDESDSANENLEEVLEINDSDILDDDDFPEIKKKPLFIEK